MVSRHQLSAMILSPSLELKTSETHARFVNLAWLETRECGLRKALFALLLFRAGCVNLRTYWSETGAASSPVPFRGS